MLTEDKVTEIFCIAEDFCKFFDEMMKKRVIEADNATRNQKYRRDPY